MRLQRRPDIQPCVCVCVCVCARARACPDERIRNHAHSKREQASIYFWVLGFGLWVSGFGLWAFGFGFSFENLGSREPRLDVSQDLRAKGQSA